MSTWSTCTWVFHSHFFFACHDRSPRTQPIFGGMCAASNKIQKSEKSLTVCTAGLFTRNLTSFALCYYLFGLFNRLQTNCKYKRKRMWFGCVQPFLWGKHCVTSQETAVEETNETVAAVEKHVWIKPMCSITDTKQVSAFDNFPSRSWGNPEITWQWRAFP